MVKGLQSVSKSSPPLRLAELAGWKVSETELRKGAKGLGLVSPVPMGEDLTDAAVFK